MKLSELEFLKLLPAFMRDDEANIALSKSINKLFGALRLDTLSTWDKIDELTEKECDELAWELDIDWYEPVNMTLEEKRETIKIAPQIKSKRGTKWAVERLVSLYLGEGGVEEWCDTIEPGIPYTFKVYTSNPDVTEEMFNNFKNAVSIAKNERSHMIGMSHRHLIKDIATGSNFYLYVDRGKLILQNSYATIEGKTFLLKDRKTGTIYHIYVSNGNLYMDVSTEKNGKDAISFISASDEGSFDVYITDGKMMIEAV